MTQDSDDLLALVFSAPIHLAPTQVKQDGDAVITSSEVTHFESHHSSSGHHEEETHETHHIVEKHYSFSHSDAHVERSGTIESEHFHNDVHERKNTASTIRSAATSVSVHSGVSGHAHEHMSYDLPKLDDVVISGETYVHERHGTGSDHSESTVTVVSSHVHQPEEAHAPAVVGDIKNPIAPYRTPSHDAVIEQFKSLHKRESVASSVQHQGEDLTPVKVTHYQFDSNDTHMGDHSTHGDLDVLSYEELPYEPIPRKAGAEVAHVESHDHHHDESHHHEPRHHDSDDEHFTFEQVEYVQKSDEPRYQHESEHAVRKYEKEADRRQSSHEQRTSTKLYDPYSLPAEMRTTGRQDDVSEELIEHVVGEIMRAVTQPGDSDHFYDSRSSLSSTIRSNKKQSGVHEKHDNTYHSVYDKEHRHHRESPLLADTHRRRDTGEQVEIRTQMHQSGHSTLVRQKERPTSDLPVNTGAVKQLRQKLEMGRSDFFEHKPHKEIDIFESLDDNANYKESAVAAPPAQEVRHQFHELRFRQPKDLAKTVVDLHHEEHDDKHHDDTCSEDSSVYHDARRTHTRVDHSRDHHRRHHDEDHHHSNAKKTHTRVEHAHEHHHDDHHRHHRRSERHHDDHDRHHEDYDRHHQSRHHHDRHEHHTEKIHAPVHRKHSEQSYSESSEYLTQYSEDENQLTVSELTNVFGGAVKLRKPDRHEHQEEHKTHKRTTSIHHIEDVVRTTNVGGNVVDPRSAAVAVHSYTPQTVQQTTGTATASRHYTPTKAAPKVTPTSAPPLAVARPTRANSEQFNSIRVVRNVRDFVSVYGRKDFQSAEQEAPVSPKGQVVPTVREEKIFSPVSVPPRPNVVHAHQEMHKKQQVVKTDGHQYTKVDAVVQQRAVAPAQVPVPAKREMHSVAAHAHPAPVEIPYYQPAHCCCCNHLMHLHHSQQHAYNLVHNPALMHNVAPMLQYHHAGEHHHEGFQYGGHHHESEHQHHHFEDHRGRADSDETFVLVTVSERRAAFEQKSSDANSSFHEGPKPMVDIYSD